MAGLPYGAVPEAEPYQKVLPREQMPDDYQHIQTDTGMFGGHQSQEMSFAAEQQGAANTRMAQAEQTVGAGALKAGQFFGQVAADNAYNDFSAKVNKLMYGDPNAKSADGTPDTGYLGKRGADALAARAGVEAQMDELMKQTRSSLATPDQQLSFDQQSRRYRTLMAERVGSHAEQQAFTYAKATNQATEQLELNFIAAHYDDHDLVTQSMNRLIGARVKQAHIEFGNDPNSTAAVEAEASARRDATKVVAQSIATKNPVAAKAFIDDPGNKAVLGTDYNVLYNQIRSRADAMDTVARTNGRMANAMLQYGTTGTYKAPEAGKPFETGPLNVDAIPAAAPAAGTDLQGFIKQKEESGVAKLTPYDDGTGHLTIGFGHTGPDVKPGMTITKEQAQSLLDQDLSKAGKEVDQLTAAAGVALTPQQRNALISLQFNTGALTAEQSTIRDKLQSGDMAGAAAEFDKWNHITVNGEKQVSNGLTKRRAEERAMFEGQQQGNHAEFLRTHGEEIIQGAYDAAIADGRDVYQAQQERTRMQSLVAGKIAVTEKAYKVDNDNVYRAIDNYVTKGNPPPSLEAMAAADPKVAQSLQRIRLQQPAMMQTLRSAVNTAQREVIGGKEQGDGPGFMKLFQQIYPPDGSAAKIQDITKVQQFLEQSNPDHITYQGFQKLKSAIDGLNSKDPDSIAKQAQNKQFSGQVEYAKQQLVREMQVGNFVMKSPEGEKAFNQQFFPLLNAAIADANKDGGPGTMAILTPGNKDYAVDKIIEKLKPTPAQQTAIEKNQAPKFEPARKFDETPYLAKGSNGTYTFPSEQAQNAFEFEIRRAVGKTITQQDAETLMMNIRDANGNPIYVKKLGPQAPVAQ